MQPSWSIPIPQAMQQHGGAPNSKPAPPDPKKTSLRQDVTAPANDTVSGRAKELEVGLDPA